MWLNGPVDHQKITGPLACAELFRVCDAKSGECDFPKLTMKKSGLQYADIDKKARWNILRNNQDAKKKVGYILSEYVIETKDDMIKEFENYKDKHYCCEISTGAINSHFGYTLSNKLGCSLTS